MKNHKASPTRLGSLCAFAGVILFLISGCDSDIPSGDTTSERSAQDAAPVFDARFHKLGNWNEMQPLSKWKGKYMVLNFWATWCKSCHHEVPELNKLYHQFKGKNTVVVGLAVDNADKVKDYVEQYGVDYPVLVGGDEALQLSKKMGNKIEGLPFTIMITPDGKVVETILGSTKQGTLPRVLTPHLS